jgi:anti-sigma factor RsiW
METAIVEISCAEVWREISNYVDGEVDPELQSRMELHFQKCRHCTAVLEGTQNIVHLLVDGDWYPLPPGFGERLFHRLSSECCKNNS